MNVRFAELCRNKPLEFQGTEWGIFADNVSDGRTSTDVALKCEKDIYLGVFFDGTNNNKYRDTLGCSQSNVARLYEVYPGTVATQTAPQFLPRVEPDGSKTERKIFPDMSFKANSVAADDYPYYRKLYVPGLGTPLPDVADNGQSLDKSLGLAMALLGRVRLDWALLQFVNQLHAAIFRSPLSATIDFKAALTRQKSGAKVPPLTNAFQFVEAAHNAIQAKAQQLFEQAETLTGTYTSDSVQQLLDEYERRLGEALVKRGERTPPRLRKIRLSVFGFSRGSAEARAWINLVTRRWGGRNVGKSTTCPGIPLQIDFLGLFDTVASVGLVQIAPTLGGHFEGHGGWAGDGFMPVPSNVKRCVHLVAALEVRGSFPLDSVCQGGVLPPNCKEIVYPGVHSDVGGGYPPDDQGRALGQGAAGDKFKVSQIALAQMYREARMAGVPLAPESAMLDEQKAYFAIAPQLRDDFNAYVAATRTGSIAPTAGTGNERFASMYPTETQPREELYRIMRRHAGYSLRWRKAVMNQPGGMAGLPGLKASKSEARFQDREDFRGAEEELRKEIAFLRDPDRRKFDILDDLFFDSVLTATNTGAASSLPVLPALSASVLYTSWSVQHKSLGGFLRDKQYQWDSWLRDEWDRADDDALPLAVRHFLERYVHDSRAWFKPLMRTDTGPGTMPRMVANDEDWFVLGGREKERKASVAALTQQLAQCKQQGDRAGQARCQKALDDLQLEGHPLFVGGREPYRMWGYVRHRTLYESGKMHVAADQARIEKEERDRTRQQHVDEAIAAENARHDAAIKRLLARDRQVIQENTLSDQAQREFTEGTRFSIGTENDYHASQLKALKAQATSPE